ncbi:hypothetical protein ABEB36_015659 [Hypothenemus hampei]|uniref:BESS domain-containing protein n=1 Tax=Hypothenemus hampei TaxID=57062 RepID=A0ABD1E124_HYPHA
MLLFLNPYIGSVDGTASNYNQSSPNRGIEKENNEEKENEVDNSEESPEIRSSVESSNISSHSQKQYYISQNKRKRSQEPETSRTSSLFEKYLEKKYCTDSAPATDNRIVNLFTNLGDTVKTFPEHIQVRVKRQVFNIVNQAEEESLMGNKNNPEFSSTSSQSSIPAHSATYNSQYQLSSSVYLGTSSSTEHQTEGCTFTPYQTL